MKNENYKNWNNEMKSENNNNWNNEIKNENDKVEIMNKKMKVIIIE